MEGWYTPKKIPDSAFAPFLQRRFIQPKPSSFFKCFHTHFSRPFLWSDDLAGSYMPGNCSPYKVHGIHSSIVTPPTGAIHVGQVQREENQQCGYDEAAIQRCRGDVVVLQPPASVSPSDEIVENNAADTPAEVDVDSGRGSKPTPPKMTGELT